MIQVIPFSQIDQQKWDASIRSSMQGNIYALYHSVCLACDEWLGVIYGNYEAVGVLPVKKKLGLSYSWHPQFMGPLGIFTSNSTPQIEKEMLMELKKHSWWIKMYYWQKVKVKGYETTERTFQQLDLFNTSIEGIRAGYNENTKRNCKKANKQNLSIQSITDVDLVIKTFKENKGNQIENMTDYSYQLLKKLMSYWLEKGLGYISAVYFGEHLAAIGYFLKWNTTVIYYKGAVTQHGKSIGAMHFLMDYEIERSIRSYHTFDFGGSNTSSVAQFYKGLGGVDQHYYLYEFKKFKF